MKKILVLWTICFPFLLTGIQLNASPAYPGPIQFVQPDGSRITILLKGDEKVRWAQTTDGYSILFNSEGTYEYAVLNSSNDMVPSGVKANSPENRSKEENEFLKSIPKGLLYSASQVQLMKQAWNIYSAQQQQRAFPTTGTHKLLCILIGFTDKAFTKTQEDFNNLFNQIGYTTGGATGSVKDYYAENSYGQLDLTVTVAGPYTAAHNMAYYGGNNGNGNDQNPDELVTEAVNLANSSVNYADFDNDNDGVVDGIYVIYAGYGEEAGGGANAIWAHAWYISPVTLDNKTISRYSCSSELRGNSGSTITTIGVICHEFGHVLGAPDYYDTDYSTNNQYEGTGQWDLMAGGSWNNNGVTPPHHNAYTKVYVYKWANAATLNIGATVTLQNAEDYSGSFYRYNTTTEHEYFLIENRQKTKFDAFIPGHGMIIYHVDSSYIASAGNGINTTSHQGMFVMAANATTANGVMTSASSTINSTGCPFPGTSSKTSFTDATTPNSKSWAGANTSNPITDITENTTAKTVTFNFMGGSGNCTSPTIQATAFISSAITETSMTIGWTRGNGNNVIVLAKQNSMINSDPVNGVTYTASAVFGSGQQIGSGNYVVYNGTGTSVNVTGLTPDNTYYFAIYEYSTSQNCYSLTALTGNAATEASPFISATPVSQNVSFDAGTTGFTVLSNVTWTAISDQAWCTVTSSSGSGNGNILVTYTTNSSAASRIAVITVSAAGVTPVTLTLVQDGVGMAIWPQSFETNEFPPYDWVKRNPIGGTGWDTISAGISPVPGWQLGVVTACPGGGSKMVMANYNSGTSASTDQWLISAPKAVGQEEYLKFWMRKMGAHADTMYIRLSTTGNAIANFTTTLATLSFAAGDTGWVSYLYNLNAYTGQTVYIAFHEKNANINTDSVCFFLDMVDISCVYPSTPGVISGPNSVCQGVTKTYIVPAIPNATSSVWDLPPGFIPVSTGPFSITVKFDTTAVSGDITVYGLNLCGMSITPSTLSVQVTPSPATPVVTLNGSVLLSSSPTGNQWYSQQTGIISGATNQTYQPSVNGTYYVIVNQNNCYSQQSNVYSYNIAGIDEDFLRIYGVKLYPNPVMPETELHYSLPDKSEVNIVLTTITGKIINKIVNTTQLPGDYTLKLGENQLSSGIYLLRISINGNLQNIKFIKLNK